MRREGVASFDAYPFSLPVVRNLEAVRLHPNVTFVVGENGTGKSTLLEAIAVNVGFNAEGGSRSFSFETVASHSQLHEHLRVVKGVRHPKDGYFLRAESFYNVSSEIDHLDQGYDWLPHIKESYGGLSLHAQSHGEAFLALLCGRFRRDGLYILDEPEAALSPSRQLAAVARIHELVEMGCQFIIATHSPIIMAYPRSKILLLTADGLEEAQYVNTEHYQVTKQFVNNYETMLKVLME